MRTSVAALAANLLLAGVAFPVIAADPVSITAVAPKDSLAVISVPNWPAMRAAFDQTSLARMWREPSVQRFIDDAVEDAKQDDADFSRVLARWRDLSKEVDEPMGAVGLAVHLAKTGGKDPDEPMKNLPHFVMIADFGAGAEKAEGEIVKLIREGAADGDLKLDEASRDGVVIYTFSFIEKETDAPKSDRKGMGEDDEFDFDFEFDDGESAWDHLNTMHMTRVGSVLLVGSHEPTFSTALRDMQDGRSSGFGDERVFKDAVTQIGAGNHLFGTFLLTESLRAEIRTMLGGGDMMLPIPVPLDFVKIIEATGLAEFRAASVGVKFNTERADVEQNIGLLAGSKKGLFSLLDSDTAPFAPPVFASADATSVGSMSVRFDRVMNVIREVAGTLGDEMRAEVDAGLQVFETQFGPAVRALGPNVFTMSTIQRPFSASSESQVFAIACRDDMAVNNAVGSFAQEIGAEARDFQGFQMYDGGFVPISIGIGGGYLFLGQTEAVENALRVASQPAGAAKIGDEARFRRAVAQLPHEGNGYTFIAGKETLEYSFWKWKNADKIALEQMRSMGFEIDEADEADWVDSSANKWAKKLPPVEDLSKHLGDSIMVVKPTPDGFRFTSLTLRPDSAR